MQHSQPVRPAKVMLLVIRAGGEEVGPTIRKTMHWSVGPGDLSGRCWSGHSELNAVISRLGDWVLQYLRPRVKRTWSGYQAAADSPVSFRASFGLRRLFVEQRRTQALAALLFIRKHKPRNRITSVRVFAKSAASA